MKNILILAYLLFIPITVVGQFSSETVKQIDKIENNSASDITIDPDNKVLIPYLTGGELLYYDSGVDSLGNGTEGQILSITGGILAWIDPPSTSPTTTEGDLIYNDGGGAASDTRLPVGTSGQLLSSNGTIPAWIDPPSTSPTTTLGDIIYNDGGGAASDTRLGVGTDNQLLTLVAGLPAWADAPISVPTTTLGDLSAHDGVNPVRLPVGLDGEFLVADSSQSTGLAYSSSLSGTLNPVTDWEEYTPTTQGFGAIANVDIFYRRVGDSIEIHGSFDMGASTPTEAQLGLPSGLIVDSTKTDTEAIFSGSWFRDISTGQSGGTVLITGSDTYLNFSGANVFSGNTTTALTPANGSTMAGSGARISFTAKVPIQGFSSGLDAAVSNNLLTAETANELSAKVSGAAGALLNENYDFINGNCSGSGGDYTCNFNSGIFTESPSCVASGLGSGSTESRVLTISTTSVNVQTFANGSLASSDFTLICSKQGADVNKSQVIAGVFEQIESVDTELTAENANELSAKILNNGTTASVTSENYTWVDSATRDAIGEVTIDYTSLGLTELPKINATVNAGNLFPRSAHVNVGLTSTTIYTGFSSAKEDFKIEIGLSKQGADVNKTIKGAIIGASDLSTVCQTKTLIGDITSDVDPDESDLTFNNLTIGKNYRVDLSYHFLNNTGSDADSRFTLGIEHNGSTIAAAKFRDKDANHEVKASVHKYFNASATTLTFDARSRIGSAVILGGSTATYTTLCELSDNTILDSTKFD